MKIKSMLVGMLACTAMVSCTNDDVLENNDLIQAGEKSYVAVNIVAPNATQGRSAFEHGTTGEVNVNDAVFLFLDGDYKGCANPYYLTQKNLQWQGILNNEGLDQKANVLLVEGVKKGEVPAYIVAILNPVGGANHGFTAATTLDELKQISATYTAYSNNNFVMTNAAYKEAVTNKEMIATPITLDDIKHTKAEAEQAPVTIQVERVVGKVIVDGLTAAINELNETGLTDRIDDKDNQGETADMELEFVLTGWNVLQNNVTNLFKNINATGWSIPNWNAPSLMRSWWAQDNESEGRTIYNVNDASKLTNTAYKYVEETVNQTAVKKDAMNKQNPYLLVAGYFQDKATNQPVDLVEWRGQKYTKDGYLNLVAGMANVSKYYTAVTENGVTTYTSFTADLLKLKDNKENDWGATAVLKDENTQFYTVKFLADGVTVDKENVQTASIGDVKAAIADFGEVQYWNGGNTYYWVPIMHQASTNDTNYYGVVRNHVYKMNISKISGYGTPVSEPTQGIDEPEKPTDSETYLAAEVVILDWKVVENNDVELN